MTKWKLTAPGNEYQSEMVRTAAGAGSSSMALPPFVNGILWKFVFFSGYGFMKPFLAVGITSASVTTINVFDEIVALSGYSDLGKNILMESYLTTFTFPNFGKGSALTYIVMLFAFMSVLFTKP